MSSASRESHGARRDGDVERLGARPHHGDGLRVAVGVDHERGVASGTPLAMRRAHGHRLGGGGALVEERGAREGEAREVAHHRLEVEEGLEAPLRDLRLVGRVLRVPARVFEHVALDDGRRERPVVAHPEVRAEHPVLPRDGAEVREDAGLAARVGAHLDGEGRVEADGGGDGLVDERVERGGAHRVEHGAGVGLRRADVTVDEGVRRVEDRRVAQGVHREISPRVGRLEGGAAGRELGHTGRRGQPPGGRGLRNRRRGPGCARRARRRSCRATRCWPTTRPARSARGATPTAPSAWPSA